MNWQVEVLSLISPIFALGLLREVLPPVWGAAWLGLNLCIFGVRRYLSASAHGLHSRLADRSWRTKRSFDLLDLLEGVGWIAVIWFVPQSKALDALAILALAVYGVRLGTSMAAGSVPPGSILLVFCFVALALGLRDSGHEMPGVAAFGLLILLAVLSYLPGARKRARREFEARAQSLFTSEQRTLLNTLPVGVLVTRKGKVEQCNDKLLEMFRYAPSELLGMDSRLLLASPEDRTEEELAQAVVLHGGPVTGKVTRRRSDGSTLEVEVSVGVIEAGESASRVVSVYEDVSEKLRAERELRLSRERLHLALDALQSGVWDVDLEESRFFFSRRFRSILELPADAPLDGPSGRLFFHHDFIHPDDQAAVSDARMAMLVAGAPLDAQYRVVRGDRTYWIRETALALADRYGTPYRFTGSITDTTTINEIQERLRASEAFHRNLIEASNALIWCTDVEGVLTFVNERGARELYGYSGSEMIGRPMAAFVAPESKDRLALAMQRPLNQRVPIRNLEVVHLTSAERRIFVSINAVPMFDGNGVLEGVMGIATDITYLKKRERAFQDATRLQRLIFDSAGEGIVLVRNQRIYRTNQAFADLVGGTIGELVARPLSQAFVDPDQWEEVEAQLVRLGHVIKVEQQLAHSNGSRIWCSVTGRRAEMAQHGSVYIWVFADISAAKAQEEQSWHRANHDELTGLANRRFLRDQLEQLLTRARRESAQVALLMLDLDGFKAVNDAHGHAFGDAVLKQVANRLADNVRTHDIAARLGGDEFVVVLYDLGSPQDVELMSQRLIDEIARPVQIGERTVSVGTSIGIAVFPDVAEGIGQLMQSADMAMYAAKAAGSGRYHFAVANPRSLASGRLQDP